MDKNVLEICKILSSKKAWDIKVIDVKELTSVCETLIIASASNSRQAKALAENVDELMSKNFSITPKRQEGVREGRWAILDYGDIMVHVFEQNVREFYNIERLWDDGRNTTIYNDEE